MFKLLMLSFFVCIFLYNQSLLAQEAVNSAGGNGSGTGGMVSFTVGQTIQSSISGETAMIIHGVQQPYEISVATAIENTEEIILELNVFPNPTNGTIFLIIQDFDNEKLEYELYGSAGKLIRDNIIESSRTEISMENLAPSIYFLKVTKNKIGIKTFKIIKN